MTPLLIFIFAAVLSYLTVYVIRRYAEQRQILDHPNERSSHAVPTPRGGGLAMIALVLGIGICFVSQAGVNRRLIYLVCGVIIAWVGWRDDIHSLSPCVRFGVQGIVAAISIWGLGYFKVVTIPMFGELSLGVIGDRHHLSVDHRPDQRLQLHGWDRWSGGWRGFERRHGLDVACLEYGQFIRILGGARDHGQQPGLSRAQLVARQDFYGGCWQYVHRIQFCCPAVAFFRPKWGCAAARHLADVDHHHGHGGYIYSAINQTRECVCPTSFPSLPAAGHGRLQT